MATSNRLYAGIPIPEGISLSAFKKQIKKQKMEASKEDYLEKRRIKRRLQRKPKSQKPKKPIDQVFSGVKVILDCNFDHLMEDNERVSLSTQLTRCYSENRKAVAQVELEISGFNKLLKQRFENEMMGTHLLWKNINIVESDFTVPNDAEERNKLIYLTGDADESLETLEPGFTYIVGGIVDKNRYKGLCLNKAKELGVRAARLPIDEHIKVSGRRVLTTNQAFDLLLKWLQFKDWKVAFESVIPPRKLE